MNIERRDFFKIVSAGVATAAGIDSAFASPRKTLPQDAVGILYDATLCIGCKACEVACKNRNEKPSYHSDLEEKSGVQGVWDSARDLNAYTMNKIKVYTHGTATTKDSETDGFGFIKRACMHCVDPDCASACPTSALQKDPVNGVVTWDVDACCGCRYCQVACAYMIPKFEYDKAFPELVKCELCNHVVSEGGLPGCCEFCPTGASLFGPVEELMKEAHHRLKLNPGEEYAFPVSEIGGKQKTVQKVPNYVNYVYGETEGGGTQYIMLSAIPFEKLGMPSLPNYSKASKSEGLQHTLYQGLIAPVVLLGGLIYSTYRSTKKHEEE
jgi:Fe-S-cluster-containing dehydrogenase component